MNRRQFLKVSALTTAGLLAGIPRIEASVPSADLILINGRIITIDPGDTIAEAIAVRGGRILEVGPTRLIETFADGKTTVIDLKGKTVTPGLIDSHAHLPPFGSRELLWLKLQGIQSKQKILETIAAYAAKIEDGVFINAWGLESHDLGFLNSHDLDGVTTKHPVLVVHTTGQWGFANTAALKKAGVNQATVSPPGSRVEKGPNGEPTGLLIHYPALYLVRKVISPPQPEQIRRVITHAAQLYVREGVTAVHDNFFMVTGMSNVEWMRPYFDLASSGQLPLRVKIWPYLPTLSDTQEIVAQLFGSGKPGPASPFQDLVDMKRSDPATFARVWGGLKIAIDGSGPTAGWYRNPGALMLHTPEELQQMVDAIHGAGQQISVHAAGNQAVDATLDALEAAQKAHPRPDARHRIEHAIFPSDTAFRRIRKAGVVVSTHPQFIFAWGDQWAGMRKREFIPIRSFMDEQIPLAFGADPPAFPLWQPQIALWQAVARVTQEGSRFASGESIPIKKALRVHTMGSAYAAFQECDLGSLEKGKLADMVVWDRDFLTVPTEQIRDAKALVTIVEGKVVFRREEGVS